MKSALVLSGGGANGAYELGVMRALFKGESSSTHRAPLELASLAGTSIGAFNAAVLLSGYQGSWPDALAALEHIWFDRMAADGALSPNGVFRYRPNFLEWVDPMRVVSNPMPPLRELADDASFIARDWMARLSAFVSASGGLGSRFADLIDLSTFLTPAPSDALVHEVVNAARLRQSPVALSVAATAWARGLIRVFTNQEFTDEKADCIVRASGALPGIFPAVPIEGELYVDGGIVANTPLKPAIDAGADVLHVIYLDPAPGAIPVRPLGSTIGAMGRMFVAQFAATMRRDLDVAARVNQDVAKGKDKSNRALTIHLYHPLEDAGGVLGMLDFHRDRLKLLADHGYKNTIRHDCARSGCIIPK
jgi:NTE family protein